MVESTKECQKRKVGIVMSEFKKKTLHSSSGKTVRNPKQAIAIALSVSQRYCPERKKKRSVKRRSIKRSAVKRSAVKRRSVKQSKKTTKKRSAVKRSVAKRTLPKKTKKKSL